ncbi:MAG: hypothetical protein WCY25_00620 [Moheibacter sp.]
MKTTTIIIFLFFTKSIFAQTSQKIEILDFLGWDDKEYGIFYEAILIADQFQYNETTPGTMRVNYYMDFSTHVVEYKVDCLLFGTDGGTAVNIKGKEPVKNIQGNYTHRIDNLTLYYDKDMNFLNGKNVRKHSSGEEYTMEVMLTPYDSLETVKEIIGGFYSPDDPLYNQLLNFIGY